MAKTRAAPPGWPGCITIAPAPEKIDTSPLKAGVEFASGDRNFPGAQNGRDDQRAYVSFRFSADPTYVQAYADYNNSEYNVVPVLEKTLSEEEDVRPDFLLTSQSRLIDAGIRWKNANLGGWHLPSGSAELQETSYFNKSDFFDKTKEHALAINLAPFDQSAASNWNLNLLLRGGTETHESDTIGASDSRFVTLGTDLNFNRPDGQAGVRGAAHRRPRQQPQERVDVRPAVGGRRRGLHAAPHHRARPGGGVGRLLRPPALVRGRQGQAGRGDAGRGSPAADKEIVDLGLPRDATVVAVVRQERVVVPRGDTLIRVGDEVIVLVTNESEDEVRAILTGS